MIKTLAQSPDLNLIFSYFSIEWVDASCQSRVTYLATDSLNEPLGQLYTYRKIRENIRKMRKMKSVWRGISCHFFFAFYASFFAFRISQHFVPGSAFAQKVKGFRSLFFCDINKIRSSHEIRKAYSERFVFRENTYKIPAKCEI